VEDPQIAISTPPSRIAMATLDDKMSSAANALLARTVSMEAHFHGLKFSQEERVVQLAKGITTRRLQARSFEATIKAMKAPSIEYHLCYLKTIHMAHGGDEKFDLFTKDDMGIHFPYVCGRHFQSMSSAKTRTWELVRYPRLLLPTFHQLGQKCQCAAFMSDNILSLVELSPMLTVGKFSQINIEAMLQIGSTMPTIRLAPFPFRLTDPNGAVLTPPLPIAPPSSFSFTLPPPLPLAEKITSAPLINVPPCLPSPPTAALISNYESDKSESSEEERPVGRVEEVSADSEPREEEEERKEERSREEVERTDSDVEVDDYRRKREYIADLQSQAYGKRKEAMAILEEAERLMAKAGRIQKRLDDGLKHF
jgi:hypothetical protein